MKLSRTAVSALLLCLMLLLVSGPVEFRCRIAVDSQLQEAAAMRQPEARPVVPVYEVACKQFEQPLFNGIPGKAVRTDDDAQRQLRGGLSLAGEVNASQWSLAARGAHEQRKHLKFQAQAVQMISSEFWLAPDGADSLGCETAAVAAPAITASAFRMTFAGTLTSTARNGALSRKAPMKRRSARKARILDTVAPILNSFQIPRSPLARSLGQYSTDSSTMRANPQLATMPTAQRTDRHVSSSATPMSDTRGVEVLSRTG